MKAIVNGRLVFPDRIMDGNLLMEGDRIVAAGTIAVPENAEIIDAEGLYVGPGLIDQHSHAYQQYGENLLVSRQPAETALAHLKHGTTTYIPSTDYSEPAEVQLHTVELCVEAIRNNPDTPIMGIHLEGPFINRGYGSCSDTIVPYSDEFCERIFSAAAPYALHCTYAPELSTAPALEALLQKYHITGAIGHTRAGVEDIERAVAYGAKIATHLYDAMGCEVDLEQAAALTRHPQGCTADIVMAIPELYLELICDSQGYHVKPYSILQAYRAGGEDRTVLISDAFFEVPLTEGDRDVSFDHNGGLCGSRLCIAMAARNFMRITHADIRTVFKCASTNSAKALGLYGRVGSIHAGKLANIVLVDRDFHVRKIIFKGRELPEVRD